MKEMILLILTAVIGENVLLGGFAADGITLSRRSFSQTAVFAAFTAVTATLASAAAAFAAPYLPFDWLTALAALLLTEGITLLVWLASKKLFPRFADVLPLSDVLVSVSAPAIVLLTVFRGLPLPKSCLAAFGAAVGIFLVTLLLQVVYRRIRPTHLPRGMAGLPLVLITLALLALLASAF